MQRALRPGGGICTLLFSRPERDPCLGILMGTALKQARQAPRDLIQPILGRFSAEAADTAWAEMEERRGVFMTAGGWIGPNELLLTAARR